MANNSSNKGGVATGGGIGFCGLLTIVFIVLKLIGVINWSWLWVISPIWIPIVLSLVIMVFVFILTLIIMLFKKE